MPQNKNRSELMRRQAAKVAPISVEAAEAAVAAETVLMDLEDREARRTTRNEAEAHRLGVRRM